MKNMRVFVEANVNNKERKKMKVSLCFGVYKQFGLFLTFKKFLHIIEISFFDES